MTPCPDCHRTQHHKPDCPQMFFGGDRSKPRGVVPPGAVREIGPLDPTRPPVHRTWSPLSEEMSRILGPTAELAVRRHLEARRG